MDDDSETMIVTKPVEQVFKAELLDSSEDPPWEEWSSLDNEVYTYNAKRDLHEQGLYDPGSGEVCLEYIPMSASSVFRHPYYNYPSLHDPGIMEALLLPEPPIVFPDDGQDLYLHHCEEMVHHPVKKFHSGLLEERIDLKYYYINPQNIRAMAKALNYNSFVKYLNLTESFLTTDACLHLGEMLETNNTLYELVLDGCRIGAEGLHNLLAKISKNNSLKVLDLRRNAIGDEGMEYLADAIFNGFNVVNINLASNNISGAGAAALGTAFETHNDFTHINISWNNLQTMGTAAFLTRLLENTVLKELDLSWNFLSGRLVGDILGRLFIRCPVLEHLNLNNNRLSGDAIRFIKNRLHRAKNLITLDLSFNPLTTADAALLLTKMKAEEVKVQNLLMDNVTINDEGMAALIDIGYLEHKKGTKITYGAFKGKYIPKGPDIRQLILNRIDYVLRRAPKKNKIDFAHFVLQLQKEKYHNISLRDLPHIMKLRHVHLDGDLVDAVATSFPGPPDGKLKSINIDLLVEYISRIWPDRKLPPVVVEPPPPEPEPPKKGKGKGKKEKEKKEKGK